MSSSLLRAEIAVGIALRPEHYDDIEACDTDALDFVEIQPENFMRRGGRAARALQACRERFAISIHGVEGDLGGHLPLDDEYFDALTRFCDEIEPARVSDHLSFCRTASGRQHALLNLPHNEEVVAHVADRVREASRRIGLPYALENVSYIARAPGCDLTESAFVRRVIEAAGAGLVLDLNNLVVNAHNAGFDAQAALLAMPLDRVVEVHLAGHRDVGEWKIDDHGAAVPVAVWDLYRTLVSLVGPRPTLVEWENQVPALDVVLEEVSRARAIVRSVMETTAPLPSRRFDHVGAVLS